MFSICIYGNYIVIVVSLIILNLAALPALDIVDSTFNYWNYNFQHNSYTMTNDSHQRIESWSKLLHKTV
jgi:hypothetical protein